MRKFHKERTKLGTWIHLEIGGQLYPLGRGCCRSVDSRAADCDEELERATRPVVVQEEENHGDTAADMCRGAGGCTESRRAAIKSDFDFQASSSSRGSRNKCSK